MLLAVFDTTKEILKTSGKFIFKKTTVCKVTEKRYLVFTPFKHQMKILECLCERDLLSEPQFDGSLKMAETEVFESIDHDDPFAAMTVRNFKGCDFILKDKSFIVKACFSDMYSALVTLYANLPEIINEEFDEET